MEDNSTTGQPNNIESTVANSEVIDQLQSQVKSLEIRLKHSHEEKKELEQELADLVQVNYALRDGTGARELEREKEELEHELADLERTNHVLRDGVGRITNELGEMERENQQLRQQTAGNFAQPDYEATRDRTLTKLKMGRQSSAGKAIDAFIKELTSG